MSSQKFRIGTRASELAIWQARHVQEGLARHGHMSELVLLESEGDRILDTPLPLMGGKGVFTKTLDDAMLRGEIDMAVHSFKDVPTEAVPGLWLAAVLPRADPRDALVAREGTDAFMGDGQSAYVLASGSNRRRAQWQRRFGNHTFIDIRGNVNTRLRKLAESHWAGAIFAAAGLHRIGLHRHITTYLDWMLPAPAQGAIAIYVRQADAAAAQAAGTLHHPETAACVHAERYVLNALSGGCSAPLGAWATRNGGYLTLRAGLFGLDGKDAVEVEVSAPIADAEPAERDGLTLGFMATLVFEQKGAPELMKLINSQAIASGRG